MLIMGAMLQAAGAHHRSTSPLPLLVIAAIGYGIWKLSLRTHTFRRCKRCKGSGRLYHPFMRNTFRLCPRCNGSSRLTRHGSKPGGG